MLTILSHGSLPKFLTSVEMQTPALVLHGRYDVPPREMSLALAEAMPVGSFEEVNSGHFPFLEDREGLLSAVSGFFAGLSR